MKPQALVCEDDATLRSVVGDLLEAHGWATVEAATAADAIDMATELRPDLVVLDIDLVGMSGLESIPRVRAGWPGARVVALAVTDRGLQLCLDAGACAVVTASHLDRFDELLTVLEAGVPAAA